MTEEESYYFIESFKRGIEKRKPFLEKIKYSFFKITFYLSSPIALCHPWIHFDGLISHLLTIDALGEDFYLLPRKFPFSRLLRDAGYPHPIKKDERGLFCSSVSFFDTDKKVLERLYKKFEDRWIGGNRKIPRGMGFYRDYIIQHIYIPTKTVVFYVCGFREMLEEMCRNIGSLGDNSRIGWGAVRRCIIEEMEEDWSIIKNGCAMRPIPIRMLADASEKMLIAWKPPYWAPENIELCAPPGAKVVFK